jgi:hypothetical protein
MSFRVVWRGTVLGALVGALLVAGTASAATLRGVVVHRSHHAHSFVVAMAGGRLAAVHARRSPAVGRNVRVSAARLRNGTFASKGVRVGVRTRHARVRGVVTYVNRRRGLFTVSSRGASILIHARHARRARTADVALPTVGQDVTVQTGIDDQGDLEEESLQENGTQTENIDLEGTVLAVDPTARTVTVSADDDDLAGQGVLVHVPAGFDMTKFVLGQQVKLVVTAQPDNSFLLAGSSSDDNEQEADGQNNQQGCHDSSDPPGPTTCSGHGGPGGGD